MICGLLKSDSGYCVECGAEVSVAETRRAGKCPACSDDFPMLTSGPADATEEKKAEILG